LSRQSLWLAILLVLVMPSPAKADILNLRGGLGTVVLRDRDSDESTHYAAVLLETSYRTPFLEFSLDLPLRWESQTKEFDDRVWNRKGDWLRPLSLLRYSSGEGRISGGLEVIHEWTPGEGFLVRDLSGRGEIDYILPGVRFKWSGDTLDLDAGMDRPIDPTVQAAALKWRVLGGVTLVLEGAADPEAPVAFGGDSSGGRPIADENERLTAEAAGIVMELIEGDFLDLSLGVHAGDINGEAKGKGGQLTAALDFTKSFLNRLQLAVQSVHCEGGYVPAWFNAVYPVYRWGPMEQMPAGLSPLGSAIPDRKMLSLGLQYDLGDFFSIKGGLDRFDDDSIRRAWFGAKLREINGRGMELYLWSRADDPDIRIFSEDSSLYSRASVLYNILPHFLLGISFEHAWAFREEELGFIPLNAIQLGVSYDISL